MIVDEKGNIVDKPEPVQEQGQVQGQTNTNPNQKQYTPIGTYKPSGNLVYGPDILAKLEKKITFDV